MPSRAGVWGQEGHGARVRQVPLPVHLHSLLKTACHNREIEGLLQPVSQNKEFA